MTVATAIVTISRIVAWALNTQRPIILSSEKKNM
jgi:hypothetical protein